MTKFTDHTGKSIITKQGYLLTITAFRSCLSCDLRFENGYELFNQNYNHFNRGIIRNPYHRTKFNIGFMGVGEYSSSVGNKQTLSHTKWGSMFNRCYSGKQPTYKDVTVCEEWHNFQNFAAWFEENYVEGFCLDKDVLIKGNKIYSPDTCCFVPQAINNLLVCNNSNLDTVGVHYNGRSFEAALCKRNKRIYIGKFKTLEEAREVYKKAKEDYIKEIAEEWKESLAKNVYEKLINYKI